MGKGDFEVSGREEGVSSLLSFYELGFGLWYREEERKRRGRYADSGIGYAGLSY